MLDLAYSLVIVVKECYVIAVSAGKHKGLFLHNCEWWSAVTSVQLCVWA